MTGQEGEVPAWAVHAYAGECFGITLFADLAHRVNDREQGEKLRTLAALEARMRDVIGTALRLGPPLRTPDALGRATADRLSSLHWADLSAQMLTAATKALDEFERLPPTPGFEHVAKLLIDHEKALVEFFRCEVEGRTNASLSAVTGLLSSLEQTSPHR